MWVSALKQERPPVRASLPFSFAPQSLTGHFSSKPGDEGGTQPTAILGRRSHSFKHNPFPHHPTIIFKTHPSCKPTTASTKHAIDWGIATAETNAKSSTRCFNECECSWGQPALASHSSKRVIMSSFKSHMHQHDQPCPWMYPISKSLEWCVSILP